MLPKLRKFWRLFQIELAKKSRYTASISGMRLRLQDLQNEDKQAWKLRVNQQLGQQAWKDTNGVLHHQNLPYVSENIRTELISKHHNNSLIEHFAIEKTQELVVQKYY